MQVAAIESPSHSRRGHQRHEAFISQIVLNPTVLHTILPRCDRLSHYTIPAATYNHVRFILPGIQVCMAVSPTENRKLPICAPRRLGCD